MRRFLAAIVVVALAISTAQAQVNLNDLCISTLFQSDIATPCTAAEAAGPAIQQLSNYIQTVGKATFCSNPTLYLSSFVPTSFGIASIRAASDGQIYTADSDCVRQVYGDKLIEAARAYCRLRSTCNDSPTSLTAALTYYTAGSCYPTSSIASCSSAPADSCFPSTYSAFFLRRLLLNTPVTLAQWDALLDQACTEYTAQWNALTPADKVINYNPSITCPLSKSFSRAYFASGALNITRWTGFEWSNAFTFNLSSTASVGRACDVQGQVPSTKILTLASASCPIICSTSQTLDFDTCTCVDVPLSTYCQGVFSSKAREIISVLSTLPSSFVAPPLSSGDVASRLSTSCAAYAEERLALPGYNGFTPSDWCTQFFSNWGVTDPVFLSNQVSTCAQQTSTSSQNRAAYACTFYSSVSTSLGLLAPLYRSTCSPPVAAPVALPVPPPQQPPVAPPVAVCGNGIVEAGEACDAGSQNGRCASECTTSCQRGPRCVACDAPSRILQCGEKIDVTAYFQSILSTDLACKVTRPEQIFFGQSLFFQTDGRENLFVYIRPEFQSVCNATAQDAAAANSRFSFGLNVSPCPTLFRCATTRPGYAIPAIDTVAPTISSNGLNLNVTACTSPVTVPIGVSDQCDPAPTLTLSEQLSECGGRRVWTATDNCQNVATLTQTLTAPVCGNGIVEEGEECDLGSTQNADCASGCNSTCKRAPVCVSCDVGDIVLGCGESIDITERYATLTPLGQECAPRTVEQVGVGSSLEAYVDPATQHVFIRMPRHRRTSFRCQPPGRDEDDAPAPLSTYRFGARASSCPDRLVCRLARAVEGEGLAYPAVDRTAPVPFTPLPVPALFETVCNRTALPHVSGEDACTAQVVVEPSVILSGNATCGISEARSWTIKDECGNAVALSQNVTVTQPEAPRLFVNTTPTVCLWPPNNKIFALRGVSTALETLVAPWGTCANATANPRVAIPNGPCSVLSGKKDRFGRYDRHTCRKDWDDEDDDILGTTCIVSNGTIFVVAAKGEQGKARVYTIRVELVSPCNVRVNSTIHVTVPKCSSDSCRRDSCANTTLLFVNATRVASFPSTRTSRRALKKTSDQEDAAVEQFILDMSALDADETSGGFASRIELATLEEDEEATGGMPRLSAARLLKKNMDTRRATLSGSDITIIVLLCVFVGVPALWILAVYAFGFRSLAFWRSSRRSRNYSSE